MNKSPQMDRHLAVEWRGSMKRTITTSLRAINTLAAAGILALALPASAATRTTASYTLVTDSLDSGGGAAFSASYANRAAVETVVGVSGTTIPDATARFIHHGFLPQLDPPLFAVADVAVDLAADPVLCSPGEAVTYSGSVSNLSPGDAPGVVLTLSLPGNVDFVLASAGQGSAALANNAVRYALGTIPAGTVVPYSLQVAASATGLALVTASVTVEAVDSNFANNAATAESLSVLTIHSVGSAIGGWFNPANWSPAIVPTTNHRAVVDGDIVDFYTDDATVAGLVLTGGRIAGAHRLTVTKLADWSGGELQSGLALVIPPGGVLRVTNGSAVNLRTGSGIENHGTVRLESTALQSVFGAWVTNSGLFEIVGDRSFLRFENTAFDFKNEAGAVFRRSSGAGTNRVVAAFRNEGLVENLTGVLDFGATFINGGWALVNSGTLRAASGSEICYTRAHHFTHGTTFEGPGTNLVLAATAGPNDGCEFAGDIHGDFTIAYGWMGGTFTNTGQITWAGGDFRSGGTWTIAPGGTATLTGAGDRTLVNGYGLRNHGTVRLVGASLGQSGGGAIDNHGRFEFAGDHSLRAGLIFTNRAGAILRKSSGGGVSGLDGNVFHNDGLLDLQSGTLALTGPYAPGATAGLNIYVGGLAPGTQFSRLTATGAASLNGALNVILTNGFLPAAGNAFAIVSAASRTGAFADFQADPVGNGLALAPVYVPTGVALQLVPGPAQIDPVSTQFGGGQFAFTFQGGAGARYVIEASPDVGPAASWLPVKTNLSSGIPIPFVDAEVNLFPMRLYRIRMQP